MNQLAQRPHLVQQPLGRTVDQPKQTLEPVNQFIKMLHSQGPGHALFRAVHVDQHGNVKTVDIFKQQRGAALPLQQIEDVENLQIPTPGGSYAAQQSFVFQGSDEFPRVLEFNMSTLPGGMEIGRLR